MCRPPADVPKKLSTFKGGDLQAPEVQPPKVPSEAFSCSVDCACLVSSLRRQEGKEDVKTILLNHVLPRSVNLSESNAGMVWVARRLGLPALSHVSCSFRQDQRAFFLFSGRVSGQVYLDRRLEPSVVECWSSHYTQWYPEDPR